MVRRLARGATFTDQIALEALVREADRPTQRRRKLPAEVTLVLCLALACSGPSRRSAWPTLWCVLQDLPFGG